MPQPSPPTPIHTDASMQSLTKPSKCLANRTKIGGNEISSQISRVHLKISPCGRTGVLTRRLWEMKLLHLGTGSTLIYEDACSHSLTLDSDCWRKACLEGISRDGETFCKAQWPGCSQIPSRWDISGQRGLRAGQPKQRPKSLPGVTAFRLQGYRSSTVHVYKCTC